MGGTQDRRPVRITQISVRRVAAGLTPTAGSSSTTTGTGAAAGSAGATFAVVTTQTGAASVSM